jgi:enterochelin esterase family protein
MLDVAGEFVTFRVADPQRRLTGVALVQEIARPRVGPSFVRPANGPDWLATVTARDLDRIEYLLELRCADGRTKTVLDPANPLYADGPFGRKSVVELPSYRAPAWLHASVPQGMVMEVRLASRVLQRDLTTVLWTSAGHDFEDELPLLAVHDGVDYAVYSRLLAFLDWAVAEGRIPACHAALLVPSRRNDDYSASRLYARALVEEVMPQLTAQARTPAGPQARVAMGTSLGALAMLHAQRLHPGVFGALFLQSSALFLAGPDAHEAGRPHFRQIVRFVEGVLAAPDDGVHVPAVFTCGGHEENLHGNRAVVAALSGASHPVRLVEGRDTHNWTAWRDTFDPHLLRLLTEMWS